MDRDSGFTIEDELKITIYFNGRQKSVKPFFDKNEDPNMEYLESIDLSNFDGSEVVDMNSMFKGCSSLKSIDLRNFDTSRVTDMSNLFNGCTDLQVLYMSEFNISKEKKTENMFQDINKLEYLGIDNVVDPNRIFYFSPPKSESTRNLIVCQSENLVQTSGARNICCSSYDIKEQFCKSDNYIKVTFNESSNFSYESGFKVGSDFRKIVSFIKKDNDKIGPQEKLTIEPNSTIEIHILDSIKSLEKLLSSEIDDKVKYINSIEFSFFDFEASLIKNMNSMFYGCSSLKTLDFSDFNPSSVTNMGSMFYGCSSLESIDLSNFVTSSVTDMSSMFKESISLKSVNLTNFITSQLTNMH